MITKILSAIALSLALATSVPVVQAAEPAPAVQTAASTVYDYIRQNTQGVKPNTSDMVNKVTLLGQADAKKGVDAGTVRAAVSWLAKHQKNLFESNETMETAMYYGAYLDKAYPDNETLSKIGWQAVKAVKYVYRGVEQVSDSSTQRALKKMSKEIDKYYKHN